MNVSTLQDNVSKVIVVDWVCCGERPISSVATGTSGCLLGEVEPTDGSVALSCVALGDPTMAAYAELATRETTLNKDEDDMPPAFVSVTAVLSGAAAAGIMVVAIAAAMGGVPSPCDAPSLRANGSG
eukprot:m.212407 g.212407  ORF g.212407 m.212407 type:complete len:127 (+) comp26109_c0_seq1:1699-2079(+)